MKKRWGPHIGNVSEHEWTAPQLVNRLTDQAIMRQVEGHCPTCQSPHHGQLKLAGVWRWTCCGQPVEKS
jgi:hypothetical protein